MSMHWGSHAPSQYLMHVFTARLYRCCTPVCVCVCICTCACGHLQKQAAAACTCGECFSLRINFSFKFFFLSCVGNVHTHLCRCAPLFSYSRRTCGDKTLQLPLSTRAQGSLFCVLRVLSCAADSSGIVLPTTRFNTTAPCFQLLNSTQNPSCTSCCCRPKAMPPCFQPIDSKLDLS